MDTQKHITIYTADSEFLAQRIKQNLDEEGISCILKGKYPTDLNNVILGGQPTVVDILVFEAEADRAAGIIKEIINE
ncbi:MAG: putative signal transducing protein [Flavobacteriaceae bacterium]